MDNLVAYNERYSRQLLLPGFGPAAQEKMSTAKVLVVGAGGLGVPVLQYLAGMGVGTIGVVDDDRISLSNLHRQVMYTTADVGQFKVEVAMERLKALNPIIRIIPYPVSLDVGNALDMLSDYDLVIDATDNFSARYLINDACVILQKPFVYGAVHLYEGHVSVFNLGDGPTYRCLYPVMPSANEIPDCNAVGVLGIVPGLIGSYQALEAVKVITGIGETLSGKLLVMNFLNGQQYKMKLAANPANKSRITLQPHYEMPLCNNEKVLEITGEELHQWTSSQKYFLLVDVREPHEYQSGHLPGSVSIPLTDIGTNTLLLSNNMPVIFYCQSGMRSRKAASQLVQLVPAVKAFSLRGGLFSLHNQVI